MKLEKAHTLKEIADFLKCSFIGDANHQILGLNEIHKVEKGDLVFVDHPKYYEKALKSEATTILLDKEVDFPQGKALLISEFPFDDYNKLTRYFSPVQLQNEIRGNNTIIHNSAFIYPNVFIGDNVRIGANTLLYPGVSIMSNSIIGENVVIGPNSVIGFDAFYYKKKPSGFDRMYSCGNVVIEDDVEIGASCTIDKGVSGETKIGEGTKIDNHVHIGHDTLVGKHCLLAAQVGLAGCVILEDYVTLWGQVGCASNVVIGKESIVLAQSGVSKSLEGGKTYFGSPCGEVKEKFKEMAALRQLPKFLKEK
jgi:UDP-3-O-[3-hydroxymyristoyl] glucosamine N-acyltransferase